MLRFTKFNWWDSFCIIIKITSLSEEPKDAKTKAIKTKAIKNNTNTTSVLVQFKLEGVLVQFKLEGGFQLENKISRIKF